MTHTHKQLYKSQAIYLKYLQYYYYYYYINKLAYLQTDRRPH